MIVSLVVGFPFVKIPVGSRLTDFDWSDSDWTDSDCSDCGWPNVHRDWVLTNGWISIGGAYSIGGNFGFCSSGLIFIGRVSICRILIGLTLTFVSIDEWTSIGHISSGRICRNFIGRLSIYLYIDWSDFDRWDFDLSLISIGHVSIGHSSASEQISIDGRISTGRRKQRNYLS